jgi:hypothetical protein
MAESRTVNILLDSTTITSMKINTTPQEWNAAIGYLATWNLTFPTCIIRADGDTDMVAVYYDEQGKHGYTIGAVWHEDHYGFHS